MSETEAERDERRFDDEREVHDPACLALRLDDPDSCTCGIYDDTAPAPAGDSGGER